MTNFVMTALLLFAQVIGGSGAVGGGAGVGGGVPPDIAYTGKNCDNGGSGVTATGCTITGAVSGSTIVLAVMGATAPTSVTDSSGDVPTQIGTNVTWNAGSEGASLWRVANATAGTHLITAHWGSLVNFTRIQVLVFTGANSVAPADIPSFAGISGVSSSISSGNFTTANAGEMIVAFMNASGATGITAGSPPAYTLVQAGVTAGNAAEYAPAVTAGVYTATAAATPSSQWVILSVALKK